jgi:DNA invertase Pin-like site-specific DNA recombinase
MRKAAIYLRVSTQDQTTANQECELRAVAERMGIADIAIYRDHGISGAKARDKRPAFDAMLKDATKRKFDVLMAWSVDRLGRSLPDLIGFLSEVHSLKIDLYLHQQGIDTTTPAGKAMFQMMGVFAEFERAMIQERVRAGLRRARETGTKSGKPIGRPALDPDIEAAIRASLAAGSSIRVTAREVGVSPTTVMKVSAVTRPFDPAGIGEAVV